MEDLGSVCPFVQILDLPVPQTVDNVTDALRFLDLPLAEQVIEVPKISCSPCPSRSLIPEPQSAEQLVEVPTVLSPLRIAEQIVGVPVPRGRGQGSLPGQSSTATRTMGICLCAMTEISTTTMDCNCGDSTVCSQKDEDQPQDPKVLPSRRKRNSSKKAS